MVGTRRKRSESKSKSLAVMPEAPEPLQIINAEAVNGPSDDELEKNDNLDSGVEPVYDDGYEEEEQMTDEINEEEFEINDITPNGNENVHTEDEEEKEDEEPVSGGSDNEDVHTEDEEEEEDEEPVSGGSDNEDVHAEDEEEEEEVEQENEDDEQEQEQEEDEVEEQEENEEEEEEPAEDELEEQEEYEEDEENEEEEEEEKDEYLASYGSDKEDVNTFEEVGADVSACVANTNEGLNSPEHVIVENLTDNLNDAKEANEQMAEEPISIPAENGRDISIEEVTSTVIEAKSVAEQGSQPRKKRLIRKIIVRGNEGSSISSKAGTSNEANLLCLEANEVVGVASEEGKNEKIENDKKVVGKPIVKVNKKLNSIRKENQHGQSSVKTGSVEQKPKLANNKPASKENKTIKQEFRKEEVEKSEEARFTRKQKNKRIVKEDTQIVHAKDIDEPGSSEKGKLSERVESQGMIFMCSSDTKKDCFRYKVFGLSAAKKDLVSKIYKGMRLFLFDVNLKMLYGIYKAAGPGSYDIEPRAFHSQFPSQVRFTVLKECLPIPEVKFKKVIKDNYFTKTKFDFQLNKYQVRNLCKLFNETAKKSAFKQGGPSQKPRPIDTSSTRVDRKRKRVEDSRRVERRERRPISSQDPGRRRRLSEQTRRSGHTHILRDREEMRRPIIVRAREEDRLTPLVIDERYRHPAVIYDRDAYLPTVESSALYKPYRAEDSPRSRPYSYERSPRIDHYRRDVIDYRDHEIVGTRESRHYVQQNVHDPYTIYRESGVYHEPVYDSYPSPERRPSKYYRPSDEYRPPLTERRRY